MQASLRPSHHHQAQQQQGTQQYLDYSNYDTLEAPTFEAPINVEHQNVASFDQVVYQDQQHQNSPCSNIYQASTSIYYDLSHQNYHANRTPNEVDQQQHQHHLKVIELQETYHQQQHYVAEPAPTQERQNPAHYPNTAIYGDSFVQTNCITHDVSYNQDYLAQTHGPYYQPAAGGEENNGPDHQCYQSQAAPMAYYEASVENCLEAPQLVGDDSLYQSSQIDYQQLEESRKHHEQQTFVGNENIRATNQHQQSSQRNSFSSALSTSSSCISANSAKLFSNDDDGSCEDDDDESEDSTLPRDQKKAKEANIPLSYDEIVNLSIDQFNEHIARFQYTEAQLTLMKDIRRRGKNKVAAQTCRKRKMEQIMELQHEVGELANKRMALSCDLNRLVQQHIRRASEYERLYSIIQVHMSKPASGHDSKAGEMLVFNSTSGPANDHVPRDAC